MFSGSLTPVIGAQFTNNTGATITMLEIAYTGEQWRAGVEDRGAADRLDFQLSTDATSLSTGVWTNYDILDFDSPATSVPVGALDGNAAGNRAARSITITGLSIPNGASFWIRWEDFNIANADDGLAIDDFSLTPVDQCALPYTPIFSIQGSGLTAAITGAVTTTGVVVGDHEYPGSGSTSAVVRGFFIQDLSGDGDPATSDGIFVFNGNNDSVSLGQVVRVSGTAGENQGQTQVGSVTSIVACGTGSVAPIDVTFPVPSADYLERFEGMLVRLPQTMYVTEYFQLGRFGMVVLSSGERLRQPTDMVAPGAPALALQASNNLNRITLDDATQVQNPDPILFARGGLPLSASNTLRGGDTATNIVGVLDYTWAGNSASGNAYRVRPVNALGGTVNFQPSNPRPAAAPAVGGTLNVVGMNLLNYFNTFPPPVDNCTAGVGGAATDCRGASSQAEFDRQWPKTVAAILAMNPAIVGFTEMENDGYGPASALATLVDQLNAATAPGTYAFIDADTATGQANSLGLDAIKVGLIYQPAVVTPIGQTAVLNSVAFVNGGDSGLRNRPSLAQAFQAVANGARLIVDVNHLKSKGSACDAPDAGDGQGNCNAVRVNAANHALCAGSVPRLGSRSGDRRAEPGQQSAPRLRGRAVYGERRPDGDPERHRQRSRGHRRHVRMGPGQ